MEFLTNNSNFYIGSKIFHQVIGIPIGSESAPFFVNLLLLFYKSKWLKSMKIANYGVPRKFGNIFRFTDDLMEINNGNKFEHHYNEIYPPELILKTENILHTETTFLDLHL